MIADELYADLPFADAWRALALPATDAIVDPQSVAARLAMYRLLIERGGLAALSPFWGYAAQLTWQQRSGRLGEGDAIDATSWWGACNYALSVVPYAAAMARGLVPRLVFEPPTVAYAPALDAWADALRPYHDLDTMRLRIWDAHLASIEIATKRHLSDFRTLPAAEQRFARGWVRMVELFGAAAWRTDLDRLAEQGTGDLPSRILTSENDDLPKPEQRTVRQIYALADRPDWRWPIEVGVWRRIMRSRQARDEAAELLAGLLGRGRGHTPARFRAIRYMLR